jgi:hypothetical protein
LGGHSKARFIHPNEAEVSKVDYSSKAKSCNVRGVGTIFDTCLDLGHLFLFFHTLLKISIVICIKI